MDNVELPLKYLFRENAPGMVSVKAKLMHRVVMNSSTYAETIINLLGTLQDGEVTEVDLATVHTYAEGLVSYLMNIPCFYQQIW